MHLTLEELLRLAWTSFILTRICNLPIGESFVRGFWKCSDSDERQLKQIWKVHSAEIPARHG